MQSPGGFGSPAATQDKRPVRAPARARAWAPRSPGMSGSCLRAWPVLQAEGRAFECSLMLPLLLAGFRPNWEPCGA